MNQLTFYRCPHCGNVIVKTVDSGVPVVCCGEPMQLIEPHTNDAFQEKHLPVVSRNCKISSQNCTISVQVGSIEHPMTPEHFIQFICLETERGFRIAYLQPNDRPIVEFCNCNAKPIAVYEYCNLHGLWKTNVK